MEMALGSYLKSKRVGKVVSLRDLSEKSGYSIGYIIAIEKGRRNPSPFALHCLTQSLSFEESERETAARLLLETGKAC